MLGVQAITIAFQESPRRPGPPPPDGPGEPRKHLLGPRKTVTDISELSESLRAALAQAAARPGDWDGSQRGPGPAMARVSASTARVG